jgi:hypothetical protein
MFLTFVKLHLQALKHIHPILTKDITLSVAVALVQSRLDYANSSHNIKKLQRVQTMAARLVVGNRKIPATDLLSHLHWLPVAKRIHFKIATFAYKVLTTRQPAYLRLLIHTITFPRANFDHRHCTNFISQPLAKLLANALSVLHPHTFIILSLISIRSASSLPCFKHQLKAFCFNSFPIHPLHQ